MRRYYFSFWLLFLLNNMVAVACTSLIVSGKYTNDGRSLLLKNRDTYNLYNHVLTVKGDRFQYVAIVADGDSLPYAVWSGHNEAGFAIINTAAYNLNERRPERGHGADETALLPQDATSKRRYRLNDGAIMRRALEICGSLEDFDIFSIR